MIEQHLEDGGHAVGEGDAMFDEQLQQASALLFLKIHGFRELAREQESVFDEDVGDALAKGFDAHSAMRWASARIFMIERGWAMCHCTL